MTISQVLASRWFYAVAAGLMIVLFVASQFRLHSNARPLGSVEQISELKNRSDTNVLFVLIDTLRSDRLKSYGYERDTSPNIDALASSGILFAQHMSQSSWTKCSMASMWTGNYPIRTGVLRSPNSISDDARMPAEILREAGFRTSALWRNNWISPSFGFSQGFEVYHSPRPANFPAQVRREKPTIGLVGTDQDVSRSAIEFLRTNSDERWFLYLHLMDVHQYIYDEDTALFGTTYSDIYDNSIRWVDRVLGSVIREVDLLGLREKTVIVVMADHGEAFGEHGREGHARDVYQEVTTTPFIISLPFRLEPGLVIDSATENVDVWPTLLDLLGMPPMEDVDGHSRMNDVAVAANLQQAEPSDRLRFSHIDQTWGRTKSQPKPMVAVHEGPYRLILRSGSDQAELFDRSVDPTEQKDIGKEQPEIRDRLALLAREYLERKPVWAGDDVELDESELEQLRALGYAVE